EIRDSWMRQKAIHDIMIFLHERGISTSRALRIYKTYGAEAIAVLKQNPYRLAVDIRGVGFKTADEIAANMGIARHAPQRVRAGLLYTMEKAAESGHACLPRVTLIEEAVKALQLDEGLVETELVTMLS